MNKADLKVQTKMVLRMTKINFTASKSPYIVAASVLGTLLLANIAFIIAYSDGLFALGLAFYFIPVMLAILIPLSHFDKFLNLDTKRTDFFKGCIFSYIIAALTAILLSTLMRITADRLLKSILDNMNYAIWERNQKFWPDDPFQPIQMLDMFSAFGFSGITGFFQIFSLTMFITCLIHTLMLIQKKWYGWVLDALVVVWFIILPSMSMENREAKDVIEWFYDIIIYNKSPAAQILSCLVLGAGIYSLSIFPIKRKTI